MIVTFLGTGTSQGVPVIACNCNICKSVDFKDKRLRSSVHINVENTQIIIDTGPDFRQQVLRERIEKVDAILYTHQHKDHTAGLDEVRSYNFKHDMVMPIYGRESVINQIKTEFAYIFSEKQYPGLPKIETHIIENKPFKINNIDIIPIEVMHYKLAVFGFRIHDFTYITDANHINDDELQKIKKTKVLVINALRKEKHLSHFNLKEAIEIAKKIGVEKTYFTHISHYLGRHKVVNRELPENMELAYDGLKIKI